MLAYVHHVWQGYSMLVPIEACAEAVGTGIKTKVYDKWREGHPQGQELRADGIVQVTSSGSSL